MNKKNLLKILIVAIALFLITEGILIYCYLKNDNPQITPIVNPPNSNGDKPYQPPINDKIEYHKELKDGYVKLTEKSQKQLKKRISEKGGLALDEINKLIYTQLTYLDLSHSAQLYDASTLVDFINLKYLDISYTNISSLAPLTDLTNLEYLNLNNTDISDISCLQNLINLKELNLNSTNVFDISPLWQLKNLKKLSLSSTKITNISPLVYLINLEYLTLDNTNVSDVSYLQNLINLKELSLRSTNISKIWTFKKLTNLKKLYLFNTGVSDIYPLRYLKKLIYLDVAKTNVSEAGCVKLKNELPNVFIVGP